MSTLNWVWCYIYTTKQFAHASRSFFFSFSFNFLSARYSHRRYWQNSKPKYLHKNNFDFDCKSQLSVSVFCPPFFRRDDGISANMSYVDCMQCNNVNMKLIQSLNVRLLMIRIWISLRFVDINCSRDDTNVEHLIYAMSSKLSLKTLPKFIYVVHIFLISLNSSEKNWYKFHSIWKRSTKLKLFHFEFFYINGNTNMLRYDCVNI